MTASGSNHFDPNEEVARAYYASVLNAGDAARTRAQVAFTVTSGIGTALVVGGVFAHIAVRPIWLQILGAAALSMWLVASFFFLRAVGSPVQTPAKSNVKPSEFLTVVLDRISEDRDAVQRLHATALWASGTALVLTFALVIGLMVQAGSSPSTGEPATVSISPSGLRHLKDVCPGITDPARAVVDPSSLQKPMTALRQVQCATHPSTLELATSAIQSVAFH
jgi:hypothetical protein